MGYKFADKLILTAIKNNGGAIYLAARDLGCTPQTIYNRMAKNRDIRDAVDNSRGEIIDIAEQKFRIAIQNGERWAISMALMTIGRHRGYAEHDG